VSESPQTPIPYVPDTVPQDTLLLPVVLAVPLTPIPEPLPPMLESNPILIEDVLLPARLIFIPVFVLARLVLSVRVILNPLVVLAELVLLTVIVWL
jgi:hypothetical protein